MKEMDNMEDSGFDSDQKSIQNDSATAKTQVNGTPVKSLNTYKKSTDLQKKIDRHKEIAAKKAITSQPKKPYLLSRNRLTVPQKNDIKPMNQDDQPLVAIMTDESDDDFETPVISKAAQKEINQQLIKDGYNLDLEPDDEDLDLIPPRPVEERCSCCNTYYGICTIQ